MTGCTFVYSIDQMFYTAEMTKPALKTRRYLFAATIILLTLVAWGGTLLLQELLHLDNYKEQILSELQKTLNRKVTYDAATFTFNFGPSFTFTKVTILERDGSAPFVTAQNLTFDIALLPLIKKKIVLKGIALDRPQISLYRDSVGKMNVDDLLEEKKGEVPLQIKAVRIRKGTIRLSDAAAGSGTVNMVLSEMDVSISHLTRGKKCAFQITAQMSEAGQSGAIKLTGSAKLAARDKPLTETAITATLVANNIDVEPYWPYYSRFVPFKKIAGRLDIDSVVKGKLREFTSKGTMKISGLRFDYPQVFHAVLTPRDLHFSYDFQLEPNDIRVKSLDAFIDGARIKGSCAIQDIHSKDLRITARASSSPIPLESFHQYIPYGVIVKETAEYIEQHIKGGTYKLDEGTLDGRISQILHMERGENYNILAVHGRVEKGILSYGRDIPAFNRIKGELELQGKDFLLRKMTGYFGSSPFSLEGRIADYPLDTPSSYPFEMNMTPRQSEVAWLLGKEYGSKVHFSGESRLHLSGAGQTSGYNLSGDWSLTPAQYRVAEMVDKPAGRANLISFKGSINKQEAQLAALQYNLAPLSLVIGATYRFAAPNKLTLDIRSNRLAAEEVAPLLPSFSKYHPAGQMQASVRGESATGHLNDLQWQGTSTFSSFSFKPSDQFKPFSNINGSINFNGTTIETSQLVATLGTSTVYCRGSMNGFANPSVNLTFSIPSLNMADLGLRSPQKEVKATRVQGNVALSDNNIRIKWLKGEIGNSAAIIKGTIHNLDHPNIDLALSSPYLDLNDLILLTELKSDRNGGEPRDVSVKASIHAEHGKGYGVDFEKLKGSVVMENRILYLQSMEAAAFGGEIHGKGRLDPGVDGTSPRYQLSCSIDDVSVERFLDAFGIKKHDLTGTMSLQAELTAKGHSTLEAKKTALGSVKFTCERGSLKRFPVLSKVLSILNLSQLLKLRLPDMISGGMPYNDISASISIQDGIASCQDFFIASNAMNISAVGKIDLVRNDLDATIGVQPLQTVDKVVNHIPVVGWILTGNKKAFLTTYFEAKGRLEDPVVRAIPVKSIGKGVLNIFTRVFELPAKLFTDTGEVLIGK